MIYKHLPFFYPMVKLLFPAADMDRVIITYGPNIYSRQSIPAAIVAHEMIHCKQQKNSRIYGIYWWIKYALSPGFRMSQEVAAYRAQYQWVCANDRKNKGWWIERMAHDLSTYYDLHIDIKQAKNLII